jgi:tRNA(Ile)-lysidine synthase
LSTNHHCQQITMHSFEKKILGTCSRHRLFSEGDRVLVAVSGGSDSVALLHVLSVLAGQLGIFLAVVHVNHGLRPSEDTDEEALVQRYAADCGLACHSACLAVRELAQEKGLSLEEAARNLRYAYFDQVMHIEDAAKICVGHHADDQAEEVLLRLIRGAGRKGLSGMDLIRDGKIVRPLLAVSKAEIADYLQDRSIAWLDDSSNNSLKFLRNRVRLELLPFLQDFNPNIADILRRTAGVLKDEEVVLDEIATVTYRRSVKTVAGKNHAPAGLLLDLNSLAGEHTAIKRRVVEKALIQMMLQPSYTFITEIIELLDKKRGSLLHLPRGLRVVRQPAALALSYPKGITTERGDLLECEPFRIEIDQPGDYAFAAGDTQISVELLDSIPSPAELKSNEADYFDHAQLSFPFTLRSRLPGDRLTPLGGMGTKKVARLLSDLKIAPTVRDLIPVIVGDGEVAGVLGLCTSQRFRVQATTREVLKIRIKPLVVNKLP